jgi:hypothetical protein
MRFLWLGSVETSDITEELLTLNMTITCPKEVRANITNRWRDSKEGRKNNIHNKRAEDITSVS